MFITFEGGEGSGKSTQIRRLADRLESGGHNPVVTREPGGTLEAEKIRDLLVQREGGDWSPEAEALLLFAARAMHVRDLIKPSLEAGKIVLCDRFTDSTRAYQCYGHGFPLDKIEELNRIALNAFEPDLTFILDIDPEQGLARSQKRLANVSAADPSKTEDRFERLELEFHRRLREGFLKIAENAHERCVVLDASLPVDALAGEIARVVEAELGG